MKAPPAPLTNRTPMTTRARRPLPHTRTPALPALCLALLLAGCAATPYTRPPLQVPAQWQQQPAQTDAAPDSASATLADRWWATLDDAQLAALVDEALARNPNLAAAAWRVRSARLAAGNAAANLWPTPSASLNASRSRALDGDSPATRAASTSLGLSWEADLWGKLAAQRDQAAWEAAATAQDREAAAQALVATVAKAYWQIALLDAQIASQQASIATARQTLTLVDTQYQAGAVSGLEQAQTRQALAAQEAALTTLVQSRQALRHALAIVFDAPPDALPAAAQAPRLPDTARLPAVAAGVPAQVLARRPDVQAAELRLRAALAQVDATRASYYPTLSLTGALGTGSNALSGVLRNPALTLGAGLALPFLRVGEMRRHTAIAQSSYEQAIIGFRQALYTALAEVEDALSARGQLIVQEEALQRSWQEAQRAEQLTEVRYRAGAVAMRAWLDAQETRRSAHMALLQVRFNRAANLLATYQALGGTPVLPPVDGAPE